MWPTKWVQQNPVAYQYVPYKMPFLECKTHPCSSTVLDSSVMFMFIPEVLHEWIWESTWAKRWWISVIQVQRLSGRMISCRDKKNMRASARAVWTLNFQFSRGVELDVDFLLVVTLRNWTVFIPMSQWVPKKTDQFFKDVEQNQPCFCRFSRCPNFLL